MLPIRLTLPLASHGRLKDAFHEADAALTEASHARTALERVSESQITTLDAVKDTLALAYAYRNAWCTFYRRRPPTVAPSRLWSGFAWHTSPSLEGQRWRTEGPHKIVTATCPEVEYVMVAWLICELHFALAYHGTGDKHYLRAIVALGSGSYYHERLCSRVPFSVRACMAECRPACRSAMLSLLAALAVRSSDGDPRWAAERASDAVRYTRSAGDHAYSAFARFCWTMRQVTWADMFMTYANSLLKRVLTEEAMFMSSADEKALEILQLAARAAHISVLYASVALGYRPYAVQVASTESKLYREFGPQGNEKRIAEACMHVATEAMDAYDIRQPMVPARRLSLTMAATFARFVHFQEKVLKRTPFTDGPAPYRASLEFSEVE